MGGKILDYPAKDILNKGRAEGDKNRLISQIQRKLAKGKSAEAIADEVEETVDAVLAIIKEDWKTIRLSYTIEFIHAQQKQTHQIGEIG